MRTQLFWSLLRFTRDVAILMVAALALVAVLGLLLPPWTITVIQGILYAGSVLFVFGMLFWGLQILNAGAWRAAGAPTLWQRWYLWGARAFLAGLLLFLMGLWLQGTILGVWVDFPPPPF
ncbi:MAG: hypothetical protein KKA73_12840 [Chloroflexi bacterium]|nr:hypothetical protein [Chloroflexota bacterium]MBU1748567.1 hypothetical protein [Chloroflexota bacterium]MBU1878432.1 hypothetical protein [Chloroflexota bacterium]